MTPYLKLLKSSCEFLVFMGDVFAEEAILLPFWIIENLYI